MSRRLLAFALTLVPLAPAACDSGPVTSVVITNDYPGYVVHQAFWQAVAFTSPVAPGRSSDPQSTLPASGDTAYVVLTPASGSTTSFVVLQSRSPLGVSLGDTLDIHVSDATFTGNCAANSPLTQSQADLITQRIFPSVFASYTYDAATCSTTVTGEAATP